MNIVIYARYSSSVQREESIEGQLNACYAYAKSNNYIVIDEYIDRAATATNDQRPQFQKMLADSDKKQFQGVLVYQLDRFVRNRYDSAINKGKLKKNGVRVFSAKENLSDDPAGIMLEGMLETMAEYFSADMAQKIRRGHKVNAEKCVYNGGNIPLGYKIDSERHYQIDEVTAPIVRKVFAQYADGKSIVDIVEELNANGLRTFKGTPYNENSFRTLLQNRRYLGIFKYDDVEIPGGMPQIIDESTFNMVQDKIKRNKISPACKDKYLLTTKLFCGHCKDLMVGISGTSHTGKLHSYYSCNNTRKKKCDKKNVKKDYIEDLVVEQCRSVLTDDNIAKIAKEVSALCEAEANSPYVQSLKKEIAQTESAIDNLMKALEKGQEADLILGRIKSNRDTQRGLEAQLAKEQLSKTILSESEIMFFLSELKNGNADTIKYRKALINVFINRIYLFDDRIKIIFNSGDRPVEITDSLLSELNIEEGSYSVKNGVPVKNTHRMMGYFFTSITKQAAVQGACMRRRWTADFAAGKSCKAPDG